jgi:hypothetical protein
LDIWHWNEEVLQSAQIVNKNRDMKKAYLAVFHLDSEKAVQLETTVFSGIRQIKKGDSDKLLAWSNRPYAVQSMWEGSPVRNDFYLVDIQTGVAEMIKKDIRATPQVSPEGKYLYWYSAVDTSWNTFNIETGKEFKITSPANVQCADEINDIPNFPDSYRTAGWTKNDESLLVYDRFDLWKVQPENQEKPVNLTQNGRQKNISYRLVKFDEERGSGRFGGGDEKGIDIEKPLFLTGHNEITRADGYYLLDLNKKAEPKELISGNFKLNTPKKAKDEEVLVFSKEDFQTYPDLTCNRFKFQKTTANQQCSAAAKGFYLGNCRTGFVDFAGWTETGRNFA